MKHTLRIFPLLLLLFLSACECERYRCPAFNSNAWVPGAEFAYREAASSEKITFRVNINNQSSSYGEDETVLAFSCNQSDCVGTATVAASAVLPSGQVLPLQLSLANNYHGKTFNHTRLRYTIGDMESELMVSSLMEASHIQETDAWYPDSVSSVNTGLSIYPDVLIQTRKAGNNEQAVIKTYWYGNGRLIGFVLQNGVTYWLE